MCPHCAQTCRSALRRQLKGPKLVWLLRAQRGRKVRTSWVAVHRWPRKKTRRICEVGTQFLFKTFCGRRTVHGNKRVRCTEARKAVGPRDPDNKCKSAVQEARSLATSVAGHSQHSQPADKKRRGSRCELHRSACKMH